MQRATLAVYDSLLKTEMEGRFLETAHPATTGIPRPGTI
jgi:hypothetical protein